MNDHLSRDNRIHSALQMPPWTTDKQSFNFPQPLIFESAVFADLLFGQIFEGVGILVLESHEIYISNNKVKLYVFIS